MKPRFEKVFANTGHSFRLMEYRRKRFDGPWHFHPEMELTLIVGSEGRRFVGDGIEPFRAGDFVLLGPNLPHFWHSAPEAGPRPAHAVVAQFAAGFPEREFLELPEAAALKKLFARASRGLVFSGSRADQAASLFRTAAGRSGLDALLQLLGVLGLLATAKSRPLASESFMPRPSQHLERRLSRVYEFLNQHYAGPLELAQVARVAAMTPAGFSRYFKRAVGENFSVTLNRLRVDAAARRLVETEEKVAEIAFAVGFATLSNFNRRFIDFKGLRPREYRQSFHRP